VADSGDGMLERPLAAPRGHWMTARCKSAADSEIIKRCWSLGHVRNAVSDFTVHLDLQQLLRLKVRYRRHRLTSLMSS